MICATMNVILLNKRIDRQNRRDAFIPTQIAGVSVYSYRHSSNDGGFVSEIDKYKIRIPVSAKVQGSRSYVPSGTYDIMDDEEACRKWTLHNGDLIILYDGEFADVDTPVFDGTSLSMEDVEILAANSGLEKAIIHINEYADNTVRGSDRVRHWRIEGV